jgi:glycosyltransferase involved in cell wall biosynthesis
MQDVSMSAALPAIRELSLQYQTVFDGLMQDEPPLSADTLVLHHTVDWLQLAALAHALDSTGIKSALTRQAICLMFNPGVSHQGVVGSVRRLLNYRLCLSQLKSQQGVRFFAACEELRQTYARFCGLGPSVTVHPVLHFDAHQWARRKSGAGPRSRAVLLYVGDAKEAKGFLDLPALALSVLRETDRSIVIQFGLDDGLRSPAISAAAAQLRQLADAFPNRLSLISEYVSDEEMRGLFEQVESMVFNYRTERYADQTSGVLWQAIAAGVAIGIIGESWLSREARRLRPGARVFPDAPSFVSALAAAVLWTDAVPAAAHMALQHAYTSSLFRPIGQFLKEVVAAKATDEDDVAGAPNLRQVLVIDAHPPQPVRSAGAHAAWQEMMLLRDLGMRVSVTAVSSKRIEEMSLQQLVESRLEWLPGGKQLGSLLARQGRDYAVVYLTRFHVAEQVLPQVRQYAPQARVLLNLADLHYLRLQREAELLQNQDMRRHAEAIKRREVSVMSKVDMVLTYTEEEATLIMRELRGQISVQRLPWVDTPRPMHRAAVPAVGLRRDLLFVGAFEHGPNTDAVRWFAAEVMPLVRREVPGVRLRVCGSNAPEVVGHLAADDIVVEGFVPDLSAAFDTCRIFVAPLRFGAGIKGKVAAALCAGVPTIASPVAAEGFVGPGVMGVSSIASTPAQWVEAITLITRDDRVWRQLSRSALTFARHRFSHAAGLKAMAEVVARAVGSPQAPGLALHLEQLR